MPKAKLHLSFVTYALKLAKTLPIKMKLEHLQGIKPLSKSVRYIFAYASLTPLYMTKALAQQSDIVDVTEPDISQMIPKELMDASSSSGVLTFALTIGAISAAMISAVWLIRERGKLDTENTQLRAQLRDLQARSSRYNALLLDSDQRVVIWEGQDGPIEILGQLPSESSTPIKDDSFLQFEQWLDPRSYPKFEDALKHLKQNAQSFDLIVETEHGEVLQAEGRLSGARAFVRFVALKNLRQDQATLTIERDRLVGALECFQNLLDVIEMPVWMRDPDGKLSWVNEAFADATEASSGQDAVDKGLELLGNQSREKIRMMSTNERPFYDKLSTVVRGNRRFYDVADTKSAFGSAGMAVDVTREEEVNRELENTLQNHISVLENLATPIAIFDRNQQLQFHNQAFQKLWDIDLVFLAGKPDNNAFFERLRADDKLPDQPGWREWKEEMLSIYHSVEPQSHLWHLADGQTLNVMTNANPQGGAIWVFENLTEKVNLETRYNTLLQVQGQTIDHLAEGVVVFASDGTLSLSNPAFRALWALTEEQTKTGTHIRNIVKHCQSSYEQNDGWQQFANIITSLDDTRLTHEGRLELITGLILDYALVPLTNGLTMLTFVNMSDSVRAERMLLEKNEALMLAESIKNDFVHHVSYELRSPLTNIMGFTDLVRTPEFGSLNPIQSEYLDHIATSSSLLLTIVNDILDLATIDAGIMQLDVEDVNISHLVGEASDQVSDRMKENMLTLNIDASQAPMTMQGDYQRLKQILVKLLGNAANASVKASTISLDCFTSDSNIIFQVTDNGPGIPQEDIDKVFSRFETSGKNGYRGGAGLGLSIVKSFVGLHNGDVSISSIEGEGTTVTCSLPLTSTPSGETGRA